MWEFSYEINIYIIFGDDTLQFFKKIPGGW
jgi:hypothetical protein